MHETQKRPAFPELSQLLSLSPETHRIPSALVQQAFAELRIRHEQNPFNIILLSVDSGAGHIRQAEMMRRVLLDLARIEAKHITFSHPSSLLDNLYKYFQNNPVIHSLSGRVMDAPVFAPLARGLSHPNGSTALVQEQIREREKPVLFITTHGLGASVAQAILDEKNGFGVRGGIVELTPDTWSGNKLIAMTGRKQVPKHLIVVHDQTTKRNYEQIHGREKPVLPWGTVSPHEFLLHDGSVTTNEIPHYLVQFSGNPSTNYTEAVLEFMVSVAQQIHNEELNLTVHTMHHTEVVERVTRKACELRLTELIEIITAPDVLSAVNSRHDLLIGKGRFGIPDAQLTKGEGPLMQAASGTRIYSVWGGDHELHNAEVSQQAGRGLNLIGKPPERWRELIEADLQRNRGTLAPQSWTILALWAFFQFFDLE